MQNIGSIPQPPQNIPMNGSKPDTDRSEKILDLLHDYMPLISTVLTDLKKNFKTDPKKSDETLKSILKTLEDANKQRDDANKLMSEKAEEDKTEKALVEEKRAEEQKNQNAEIITTLKGILEGIKSGNAKTEDATSGGFLDNLLGGLNLGKFLPTIFDGISKLIPTLASIAGAILTSTPFLLLASAALGAGLGHLLWKTWLEPLMEKQFNQKTQAISDVTKFVAKQSTDESGNKLYIQTDDKGISKVISESELSKIAETQGKTLDQYISDQESEGKIRKLTYKEDARGNLLEGKKTYTQEEMGAETTKIAAKQLESTEEVNQRAMSDIIDAKFKDKDFSKLTEEEKSNYAKQALSDYAAVSGKNLSIEQSEGLTKQFMDMMNNPDALKTYGNINQRQIREKSIGNLMEDADRMHNRMVALLQQTYTSDDDAAKGLESLKVLVQDMGQILYPPRAKTTLKNKKRYEGLTEEDIKAVYNNYPLLDQLITKGQMVDKIMDPSAKTIIVDPAQGIRMGSYYVTKKDNKIRIGEPSMWNPWADPTLIEDYSNLTEFPSKAFDALKGVPQLETGGVVYPKSKNGVLTNISENMKPEAIVPLEQYDMMNNKSEVNAVDLANDITNVMRDSYFEERDASRGSNQPIVINNVSNNNSGGGGDQGVNFQYQTDLSKTFDSVFEMILEKNMKMSIS